MNSAALSVECSTQPLDFAFHPTKATLLAAALVDGTVEVHDFADLLEPQPPSKSGPKDEMDDDDDDDDDDDEVDTIISSTYVHTQLLPSKTTESGSKQASCRTVLFADQGHALYSGGAAGDLARLDTEVVCTFSAAAASSSQRSSVLWNIPDASYQKSALHVLHEIVASESGEGEEPSFTRGMLVTGDDAGGIRVWDPRIMGASTASSNSINKAPPGGRKPTGCVFSWKEHDDYVSDIAHSADGLTLLASSADCTLSVYDLRMAKLAQQQHVDKEKIVRRSDDQEDELLSLQIIKNGRKVVCGTAEGILAVWSWGTWGDISDRFPGHPASLDALVKVDEDTLLTGSMDGLIRLISVHPDKLLGVLGDHEGFPIEKLAFNADRNYVGSLTHDSIIRLWDTSILKDDYTGEQRIKTDGVAASFPVSTAQDARLSDGEWDDMDEDAEMKDDDSDDSDSDDEADGKRTSKNDARAGRLKTENEKFFEDL